MEILLESIILIRYNNNILSTGHHYPDKTEKPLVPVLPLEIFKVKPNKNYRFRIINAATFVSFRFSIDEVCVFIYFIQLYTDYGS